MTNPTAAKPIPFIDLQAQRARLGPAMDQAIAQAVAGGQWILGPQVAALEEQLAAFAGTKLPICDRIVSSATCRMYVDLPAMFGPVMMSICCVSLSRYTSFGT